MRPIFYFAFSFFLGTSGSENQVALFINFVARLKCYCQLWTIMDQIWAWARTTEIRTKWAKLNRPITHFKAIGKSEKNKGGQEKQRDFCCSRKDKHWKHKNGWRLFPATKAPLFFCRRSFASIKTASFSSLSLQTRSLFTFFCLSRYSVIVVSPCLSFGCSLFYTEWLSNLQNFNAFLKLLNTQLEILMLGAVVFIFYIDLHQLRWFMKWTVTCELWDKER